MPKNLVIIFSLDADRKLDTGQNRSGALQQNVVTMVSH